jgi:hypothetical protein
MKAQTYVLKVHPSVLKLSKEWGWWFYRLQQPWYWRRGFSRCKGGMMKNNEIELNIAQITTIHKTSKKVLILKKLNVWIKPLFWSGLVVQVNRQSWLVCKRSCKANAWATGVLVGDLPTNVV